MFCDSFIHCSITIKFSMNVLHRIILSMCEFREYWRRSSPKFLYGREWQHVFSTRSSSWGLSFINVVTILMSQWHFAWNLSVAFYTCSETKVNVRAVYHVLMHWQCAIARQILYDFFCVWVCLCVCVCVCVNEVWWQNEAGKVGDISGATGRISELGM